MYNIYWYTAQEREQNGAEEMNNINLSSNISPYLSSIEAVFADYGGLIIVFGAFFLLIIILSIIYGAVKAKRMKNMLNELELIQ